MKKVSSLGVTIASSLILLFVLAMPLGRAFARNQFALDTKALLRTTHWTSPLHLCTPVLSPPLLASAACTQADACYLNAVFALRVGEWDNVSIHLPAANEPLPMFIRGWGEWCGGSPERAVLEWQHAATIISEKFRRDGVLALAQGDAQDAREAASIANAIAPTAQTHFLSARAHDALAETENARQEYRAALTLDSSDAQLFWALADFEWRNQNFDAARIPLERALELKTDDWMYWHRYGQILLKLNEPARAEVAFLHAVALNPTYGFAHAGVASAQLAQGKIIPARESTLNAVKYLDDNKARAGYLGAYAVQLARLKNFLDAAVYFHQAVQYDPANDGFWGGLLNAYVKQGDCENARRAYAEYQAAMRAQKRTPVPPLACP